MATLPLPPRLLTVAEFAAFDEATDGHYELQEGHVVMSPSPVPEHQLAQQELQFQLRAQVPPHLRLVPAVDVDLELVGAGKPGYVRIPDLTVVTTEGLRRRRQEGGLLRAREIVLAVEIVSPGSERTDRTIKRGEYADAAIPHYWIVDLDGVASLTACHLVGEFGYAADAPTTGIFTAEQPFPVRLDLDLLA